MMNLGKVLVIDDDPLQLEVVRDYLARHGVSDIVCVADSQIAANLLRGPDEHQPNLVITDIHMPNLDGIELVGVLSQHSEPPPLVFVSGSTPEQLLAASMLAKSLGLTVLGALAKPFDEAEMGRVLHRHPMLAMQASPERATLAGLV